MHCANDPPLFDFQSNATREFIQNLVDFQKAYLPIHGGICVFLCLFGVVTNLIHCVVLTRPQMRNSAVNVIMTAVALCDLGTMSSYLVYIFHFVLRKPAEHTWCGGEGPILEMGTNRANSQGPYPRKTFPTNEQGEWGTAPVCFFPRGTMKGPRGRRSGNWFRGVGCASAECTNCWFSHNPQTYWWMLFLLLHIFFSILLHTATLWLAVVMAFLRRMTLHRNTLYSHWQRAPLARRISLGVLAAVFVLSVPSMLVHEIIEFPHDQWRPSEQCAHAHPPNYSEPLFTVVIRQSALANGCVLFKTNLWLTGILFKVIPCLLLLLLSGSLMQKLRRAEKKQCALLLNGLARHQSSGGTEAQLLNGIGANSNLKKINSDRTTAILLAILTVFLLTELPQGLIAILNAIYTADVHRFIYLTLGDVLDLLSLVNSSVNFVLYCLMSSRYRQTFCTLLIPIAGCKRCVANANQSVPLPSFASSNNLNNNNAERRNNRDIGTRRRSTPVYRWLRCEDRASVLPPARQHKMSAQMLSPPPPAVQ